jgi:propanediol utilization protein
MSPTSAESFPIPVTISARHAHLTQATLERLFGTGFRLHPARQLSQPHEFAAELAHRHIHMSPADAERFKVKDRDIVAVAIDSDERDLIFADVVVRVAPDYRTELHLDTDEGNAAGIGPGVTAVLLPRSTLSR